MYPEPFNFSPCFAAGRASGRDRVVVLRFVGVVLLFCLLGVVSTPAQPATPSEQQVKAAIVVNLPKYVEWPSEAFVSSNSPVMVSVCAPATLEEEMRLMTAKKVVGNRALELQHFEAGSDSRPLPHVLLLSGMDRKQAEALLRRCKGKPVLTVVDGDGGAPVGGIVILARKDKKVRLQIDAAAAKEAGLSISSKLLGVADLNTGGGR